jgi:hypothetical protein
LYYSTGIGAGGLVLIAKNEKWKEYTDKASATAPIANNNLNFILLILFNVVYFVNKYTPMVYNIV